MGLIPCNVIPEEILTDHPKRFRAMFIESSNPVHSLADSQRMRQALRALDVSVVIDVAMTETARQADYVLPAASQFEKAEATFFNVEFPRNGFHLRQPLFAPRPGTLTEAEIHARLVESLGELDEGQYRFLRRAARWGRTAFGLAFAWKAVAGQEDCTLRAGRSLPHAGRDPAHGLRAGCFAVGSEPDVRSQEQGRGRTGRLRRQRAGGGQQAVRRHHHQAVRRDLFRQRVRRQLACGAPARPQDQPVHRRDAGGAGNAGQQAAATGRRLPLRPVRRRAPQRHQQHLDSRCRLAPPRHLRHAAHAPRRRREDRLQGRRLGPHDDPPRPCASTARTG